MSTSDVALVRVVRNGVVESVHRGHVVLCDASGTVHGAMGDAGRWTYVRSAVKPFQALATLDLLAEGGAALDDVGLAIACASHDGSDDQQIEAARLLSEAGLDESALRCPPALPRDAETAWMQRWPYSLAHNCSGKHAAFLYASVAVGADPADYLSPDSPIQRQVRRRLADACVADPQGPGVDGCGAPAWLLPLAGLATGFARLAAARTGQLGQVRQAMTEHPELVGGPSSVDTQLMRADPRVVAKRGAEAVFAAGLDGPGGPLGIAVKVTDGGARADGPVAAAVLMGLGAAVPEEVLRPPVLGGGVPQGALEVAAEVADLARQVATVRM
jgi:L-asparaginase II